MKDYASGVSLAKQTIEFSGNRIMKLKLHHINLSTTNVTELDRFYRDVIGLDEEDKNLLPQLERNKGFTSDVAFATDGDVQLHMAERDVELSFRTGHMVNPAARGHIAYRTDDIEAFKRHLEDKGVPYSDWGNTAVQGWYQIFFYDPEGNVIEVHEVQD